MFADRLNEQARLIDLNRKIEVYRNLHKDCWSVRQDGLVKFHCDTIHMSGCSFVVQPAGHARVLREKKKNVHAFIRGYLCGFTSDEQVDAFCWDDIYYNPYKTDTFVDFEDHPVRYADFVDMSIRDKKQPVLALNPI